MYQGCVDTRNMDYLSHGDWAKHFQSSIHSFNEGMKTAKYDHITIITYQISFLPSLNYLLCQRRMCVLTGFEFFSYSNCLYLGTAALLYIIERIGWSTLKDSSCIHTCSCIKILNPILSMPNTLLFSCDMCVYSWPVEGVLYWWLIMQHSRGVNAGY